MTKKNIIPFSVQPGHWGLTGKTREIAKAEYELEGFDLESRLLEIKQEDFTEKEYKKRVIDLDYKYSKITAFDQLRQLSNLIEDPKQRDLALLELDYKENKISTQEYQKQYATLKDEPWVSVLNMDFVNKGALEGSFELDWNEAFVTKLENEGYKGLTPDNIVNAWFMELCRNIAMEEFDGQGDFTADSEANLEAYKRFNNQPLTDGKRKAFK